MSCVAKHTTNPGVLQTRLVAGNVKHSLHGLLNKGSIGAAALLLSCCCFLNTPHVQQQQPAEATARVLHLLHLH
jgi:hypothetical protein